MPPAPGQNRIFRSGEELGQGPLLLHGLDHVGHLGLVSHQDHAAQPAAGEVVPLQIALDVVPDLYGLIGGAGDLAGSPREKSSVSMPWKARMGEMVL